MTGTVTATETETANAIVTAGETMRGVTVIAMDVAGTMSMAVGDTAPVMTMTVATAEMTEMGVCEKTVAKGVVDEGEDEKARRDALRLQRVVSLSLKESERLQGGTFMLPAMSNIQQCKQNKLVRSTLQRPLPTCHAYSF